MSQFPNTVANEEWVNSIEYTDVITMKKYRKNFFKIGAWRWDGVYDHKFIISKHVFNKDMKGIDFGGYEGPIGGYATIIDKKLGNSLDDIEDASLDYIFTSHTLEHVDDINDTVWKMYLKLKDKGKIFILIPSFQREVWRAGRDPDHNYTFKLFGSVFEPAVSIDLLLETVGFKLLINKYCYKCSIFIYGEKNKNT